MPHALTIEDWLSHRELERRAAHDSGRWVVGIGLSRRIIRHRGDPLDWCWLAWFQLQLGNTEQVREALNEALSRDPSCSPAIRLLERVFPHERVETDAIAPQSNDVLPRRDVLAENRRIEELLRIIRTTAVAAPEHDSKAGRTAILEQNPLHGRWE